MSVDVAGCERGEGVEKQEGEYQNKRERNQCKRKRRPRAFENMYLKSGLTSFFYMIKYIKFFVIFIVVSVYALDLEKRFWMPFCLLLTSRHILFHVGAGKGQGEVPVQEAPPSQSLKTHTHKDTIHRNHTHKHMHTLGLLTQSFPSCMWMDQVITKHKSSPAPLRDSQKSLRAWREEKKASRSPK